MYSIVSLSFRHSPPQCDTAVIDLSVTVTYVTVSLCGFALNKHPIGRKEDARAKFQNPDFRPDFHADLTVSPHDGLHFWQFMIAGSIAGCVEHMAMFPVDTVKTRMQALGLCPVKTGTVRQALKSILQWEGPSALYRGIGAMGLGAGPVHAVYFSVYETCKKRFSVGKPKNAAAHAASGVCATVASDAVFTPMDMVKQRLQLGNSGYKGVWHCAAKRGLMEVSPDSVDDERLVVHATAGAAAGALAAAGTTPFDVVKNQLQCQGVCGCDRFKSGSIGDVVRTILNKDGYRGLMRGWIPRMLFHAPGAAICWSTYEAGKSFFQDFNQQKDLELLPNCIQIAFELRMPHKLFELFAELCRKREAEDHIDRALKALGDEELHILFNYARKWNTKPRLCYIHSLYFSEFSASFLQQILFRLKELVNFLKALSHIVRGIISEYDIPSKSGNMHYIIRTTLETWVMCVVRNKCAIRTMAIHTTLEVTNTLRNSYYVYNP
ncbi:unnamed protein product [Sphenostylis stenocarpa]|uniref:U3 small nucleolar RNA-associated protein 13 C-terminal domain-containing protein n=1 Tax=Sphenostylis stenocarpa TaxID=92480 RepID=A0AA86VF07_9FABA|nr:unnamed protein product [Sphenostylis stenocarpa]